MEREEMGCQTFNERVSRKAMTEDKYYSSASKKLTTTGQSKVNWANTIMT